MRSFSGFVLFLAILLGGGAFLYGEFAPCRRPVLLTVGSVDARFRTGTGEFLSALEDAAALWEDAADKDLFRAVPSGGMPVSAVYDGRQAARDQLRAIGLSLDEGRRSYDALKAKVDALRATYDRTLAAYTSQKESFEARKAAFQRAVDAAKPEDEAFLLRERDAINALVDPLNAQGDRVRRAADEVNAMIVLLNGIAERENLSAEAYRAAGSALGDEYEAGLFSSDATGRRVTIYAFENRNELSGILAHELGHALGLGHLESPDALMYRLSRTDAHPPVLSAEDTAALRERCTVFAPLLALENLRFAVLSWWNGFMAGM